MPFLSRDKIDDIGDVDELFRIMTKRKHWKHIRPEILRRIFDNAKGDITRIQRFRYVSELHHCVANNFIEISKDDNTEMAVAFFAVTLERLAAGIAQQIEGFAEKSEQQNLAIGSVEIAYMSSILCNPLVLPSYAGLAFFYSMIGNKKRALETFKEYDQAEQNLMQTDDKALSYYDKALKEKLPEMRKQLFELRTELESV